MLPKQIRKWNAALDIAYKLGVGLYANESIFKIVFPHGKTIELATVEDVFNYLCGYKHGKENRVEK